jgi:hypothetical protein
VQPVARPTILMAEERLNFLKEVSTWATKQPLIETPLKTMSDTIVILEIVWNACQKGYDVYFDKGGRLFSIVHPSEWGAVEMLYVWSKIYK